MKISFNHGIKEHDTASLQKRGREYLEDIIRTIDTSDYKKHESALLVAHDARYQDAIQEAMASYSEVRHVVLIGIGGSSLGTEAVYHALKSPESSSLLVIDAIEPSSISELSSLLDSVKNPKHIAFVIVSKSGTTTETILNADLALTLVEKTYGSDGLAQIIVISDEGSALIRGAEEKNIRTFTIPPAIGGRYSVFTAVGIVPLTLLGIDVAALRKGAMEALSKEGLASALESAAIIAAHALDGAHTLNFFTFEKRLATFGFWYRQLLAESLGKSQTKRGDVCTAHLLPTISTSIDLHSVGQLYLGGYQGVYTKFMHAKATEEGSIGKTWAAEPVPALKGKTPGAVKRAITEGVLKAYDEALLAYEAIELDAIDASIVGRLLTLNMLEVMLICAMLDVDAFDQPNVESYKKYVRTALDS